MSRTTKLELTQINARLAAENAELRTQISELRVRTVACADPYTGGTYSVSDHQPTDAQLDAASSDERVHEYDTPAEAMARCKELVAWDKARKFMFVVRGNRVICKIRHTHH